MLDTHGNCLFRCYLYRIFMKHEEYDGFFSKIYDVALFPFLAGIRRSIAAIVQERAPSPVLDICCGTGDQLKYLARLGRTHDVGIDLSPAMLAQSSRGIAVDCRYMDAAHTVFPDGSFAMAMTTLALHEKPRSIAEDIICEAKRVVKPGGYFLAVDFAFTDVFPPALLGVAAVERMAGGEHYENFKRYRAYGGMDALMNGERVIDEKHFLFGAVVLRLYQWY